jgi:hypothetical protein
VSDQTAMLAPPDAPYTRSNGQVVNCADMVTNHLKSAYAKLEREAPGHPELPGMSAWIAYRDALFAEAEAAKETAK